MFCHIATNLFNGTFTEWRGSNNHVSSCVVQYNVNITLFWNLFTSIISILTCFVSICKWLTYNIIKQFQWFSKQAVYKKNMTRNFSTSNGNWGFYLARNLPTDIHF